MTDCPNGEVHDLLPDLLHDRLAPDVRREVEAHVHGCADCQAELALLGAMRSSLRRVAPIDVASIATSIPPYRAPVRHVWAGWRAAAAIVILAAGGASVAVVQRDGSVARDSLSVAAGPVALSAPATPAAVAAPRELALGSAAVGDLNDGELSALLADLETLEALPSPDVESATSIVPVSLTGT
jgi:hypothetical protein